MRVNNCFVSFAYLLLGGVAYAASFSAVNDFSLAANPNGPWSYSDAGTVLPTPVVGTGTLAGVSYWWDSQPIPNSAVIGKNTTGSTVAFETIVLPPDHLWLDPESNSNVDARLTLPVAGTYDITGDFLGIDSSENSHPVEILDNGVVIFSGTIGSYGQSDTFNLVESLNAGDVLDFEVLTGSTYANLSTGLSATITPASATPEPQSLWLAGLGLIGVSLLHRTTLKRTGQ